MWRRFVSAGVVVQCAPTGKDLITQFQAKAMIHEFDEVGNSKVILAEVCFILLLHVGEDTF